MCGQVGKDLLLESSSSHQQCPWGNLLRSGNNRLMSEDPGEVSSFVKPSEERVACGGEVGQINCSQPLFWAPVDILDQPLESLA